MDGIVPFGVSISAVTAARESTSTSNLCEKTGRDNDRKPLRTRLNRVARATRGAHGRILREILTVSPGF